jgi:hypothetical protein
MVSFTPKCFTPGEKAVGSQWIEDWVGHKTGIDNKEGRKSCL